MERNKIGSFNNLKHGDKIISPIDNVVTEFFIDKEGEKYLADQRSVWAYWQFDADDFYFYDGDKEVGETDKDYFNL